MEIGEMISAAMEKVGRKGVIPKKRSSTTTSSSLKVCNSSGYISPYFVTDSERMTCVYDQCKLLIVDKKISTARDMIGILGCHPTGFQP